MNRIFVSLALFGLLLSACASSPTTAGPSVGTIVAATMQALTAAAPQPTAFLVNPDGQFDLNDPNVGLSADGVPFPGYTSMNPADYEDYFGAVADKLNASAPEIFSPSLTLLDALIQSITVTP
jgi:hypothetical protein